MPTVNYPPELSADPSTATQTRYTCVGCSGGTFHSIVSTATQYRHVTERTAQGFETPGWRKIRNAGALLPMTPWTRFERDLTANESNRIYCTSSGTRRFVWTNNFTSTPSILSMDQGWFVSKVNPYDLEYFVQQAAAAIYSSGWDAATFLAEIGQLRRMLSGIGKKLDDLSHGRSPGEIYDLYLEGRYGWRTLMYDIRDLHEVLSTANERRTRYREARGMTDAGLWNDYSESTSNGVVTGVENSVSWTTNLRGTVVADIEIPDFQFNPVTTGWEVVRLSFLVDWLLNVGQALEASSFLLKAKSYQAAGGVRMDFHLNGLYHDLGGVSGTTVTINSASWHGSATFIQRVPMPVSALPRMKLRLNEWKVLDILALIAQRLR